MQFTEISKNKKVLDLPFTVKNSLITNKVLNQHIFRALSINDNILNKCDIPRQAPTILTFLPFSNLDALVKSRKLNFSPQYMGTQPAL